MPRVVTSPCSKTNITCRAEGAIVRFKWVNYQFKDSRQLYYSKKIIQREYQVTAGSLEGKCFLGLFVLDCPVLKAIFVLGLCQSH